MSVQLLLPMLMRMVASTWQLMVLAWQRYLDWASTPKHFLSAHMMMVYGYGLDKDCTDRDNYVSREVIDRTW